MRYMLAVVLLAGCQSKPIEQLSYSETKELAKQLHQRCAAQGAPRGSAEFDACMKQEVSREGSIRRDAAARRQSGIACFNSFGTVICN
ncbi:MAG: hypothetical protein EOS10_00045 [Mesorhizobium sp.]|uniref:hypothetical protein n=1 Tax=Mesorhizobium sp. TaxID=1871066 RepID=UPI000FE8E398|nr:hypothetical protein [Mesorhizobium sp.]RWO34732.1 MAG: hypothetical protein EOS10_00045 [Mesorhizobium sp.]